MNIEGKNDWFCIDSFGPGEYDIAYAFENGAKGVIYFKWGMNEELDNKKIN